jgi:hypothetical protein
MAQTICDGERVGQGTIEAIVADRNRPQKHVEQAQVVLASADDDPVQRATARPGVSRPMVRRWQERFAPASSVRY